MSSLEYTIKELIINDDMFYASFLGQCERVLDYNLPAPAGISVTSHITLYINPKLFDSLHLNVRKAILKHEVLHLINSHCGLKAADFELSHKQLNIAMDTAINQMEGISEAFERYSDMKIWTISNFREACSQYIKPESIKAGGDWLYYARIIKQCQDKFNESGAESVDDHSKLTEGDGKDGENGNAAYKDHLVKEATKKAKDKAGNVSGDLSIMLDKLFKSKINWKEQLRRFAAKAIQSERISTRRRINRRYGLMSPGRKRDYKLHVGFVLDVSGSMDESWLAQGFAEMHKMKDTFPNMKITLIEADTEVKVVKEFTKQTKPEITGRGGTALDCGFEKAKELGVDAVICFTDGDFYEKLEDLKIPTLFTIIGRSNWSGVGFGQVIYINE